MTGGAAHVQGLRGPQAGRAVPVDRAGTTPEDLPGVRGSGGSGDEARQGGRGGGDASAATSPAGPAGTGGVVERLDGRAGRGDAARRLGSLTPEFRPQDGHDPVGCSVGRTLPLFRVASAEDQDRWRHLADVGMAWCVLCYPELQADEPPVVAA